MTPPLVIVDLGATLAYGPSQGPATRISLALGLDQVQKSRLGTALMTRAWSGPHAVAAFLRDEMGVKDPATERVVSEIWRAQEREAAPVEGAEAAMTRMIEAGYQIALVSNIWPPFLAAVRAHFGTLIDAAVPPERQIYSFRVGTAKPSAALFRQALQAGKADPRRTVMIGDSYREDIEPASLLGIWTIWLLHRPAKEAANVAAILNGTAPPPSRTLLSIAEIEPDLVEALLGGDPSQPTPQPRRGERSQAEGPTNANPGCGTV